MKRVMRTAEVGITAAVEGDAAATDAAGTAGATKTTTKAEMQKTGIGETEPFSFSPFVLNDAHVYVKGSGAL